MASSAYNALARPVHIDTSSVDSSLARIEELVAASPFLASHHLPLLPTAAATATDSNLGGSGARSHIVPPFPLPFLHQAPPLAFLAQYGIRVGDIDSTTTPDASTSASAAAGATSSISNVLTSTSSGDTCATMPAAFDGGVFCWGVVDYPFLVPNGTSAGNTPCIYI